MDARATVDAAADAPLAPQPGRALAAAAGRATGGPWTLDIQLGGTVTRASATGGGWSVRDGAPFNP